MFLDGIGIKIKKAIIEQNLTQADFCTKIGIDQSHLSQIINGKKKPSMRLLEKICEELDLQVLIITKNEKLEPLYLILKQLVEIVDLTKLKNLVKQL